MRLWQHLCIGSFFVFLLACFGIAFFARELVEGPRGVGVMAAMIGLPFALGPLAYLALVLDVLRRFGAPGDRWMWALLCLLTPVALFYWIRFGFCPVPAALSPPPLPTNAPPSMRAGPPPLPIASKPPPLPPL